MSIFGTVPPTLLKPCSFSYNGKLYGGFEYYPGAASTQNVFFSGKTNFEIFGLDYYDTKGTILNDEVKSSINYNCFTYHSELYFNGAKK